MVEMKIDKNIEALIGDDVWIQLTYPRCENCHDHLMVELSDVRVGSPIRISYDFERDGWKIEMDANETCAEQMIDIKDYHEDWREVAFVQSWQFEGKAD